MLRELFLWWIAQLGALIPQSLRAGPQCSDALLITAASSRILVAERKRRRERELGEADMNQTGIASVLAMVRRRPRRVVLRIAADALLERPVELPLAAERDLQRVVAYDMDRLTPFAESEVVWQTIVTQRDTAQRRLRLQLAVVPRRTLDPHLQVLSRAGLAADWLEVSAPDGRLRPFPLTESATRQSGGRSLKLLAGVAAVMLLAAIVTPFVTQTLALRAANQAIAGLSSKVARAQMLRQRLAANTAGTDALAAERARTGDVLQVLAAVTDVMPDDTWLSELSLHEGKLRIAGQSPAAARLIPALAADPNFRNPAFAAPVTRAPDGHADLFAISAAIGS